MSDYLTVKECAALLRFSQSQILALAARKENPLPSFAIPGGEGVRMSRRFRRDEVEAWLENYRVQDAEVVELRRAG